MSFIIGADISSLEAMEDYGAKYYDLNGEEGDVIKILASHGVNCIRLRLFNKPTESFDKGDYCDLKHTLRMAKRIKKYGLGFMLDFHYSDFWADWKQQKIPNDWENLEAFEIEKMVYEYTKYVINCFIEQETVPDIVQIGNEIGNGMLWEFGNINNIKQLVKFINSGLKAIAEINQYSTNSKKIKTVLHIECGADKERTKHFFSNLNSEGLWDFDYVGLSYYPYWSGTYNLLMDNIINIGNLFHKQVIVVETAFPYTDTSNDEMQNVVTGELTKKVMGLIPSVENQEKVLEKVIKTVKMCKNGAGVFYWEPGWYQIKGVGVARGKANEWENQAVFDNNGYALKSIKAFEI